MRGLPNKNSNSDPVQSRRTATATIDDQQLLFRIQPLLAPLRLVCEDRGDEYYTDTILYSGSLAAERGEMGRYNFNPARVYERASRFLELKNAGNDSGLSRNVPHWYSTIEAIPPGEILSRPQPVQHGVRGALSAKRRSKKPSKMFKPMNIVYEEDAFRQNFYKDHPWELARPRVIVEQDGKDGQRCDWSRIEQPGRELNGER